ncbi:Nuclear envelope morphology protein 1 [Nakaseomyces bracarensis]|uniref:Nuclear envelope morphology protein 1 n=1 Tax=Nakaseomyces bracarensis TaxID=273131 RepID=A0ABR4NN83_9SACH
MNALSYTYEYLCGPFDRIKSKKAQKKISREEKAIKLDNVDIAVNTKLPLEETSEESSDTDSKSVNSAPGIHESPCEDSSNSEKEEHTIVTSTKTDGIDKQNSESAISGEMTRGLKFFIVVWSIITFFPNYLLIKPIIFIWFVLTFPLSLIEHSVRRRVAKHHDVDKGQTSSKEIQITKNGVGSLNVIDESIEDDLSSGEVMELQKDTVKGSLLTAKQTTPNKNKNSKVGSSPSHMSNTLGTKSMGRFQFPKKLIPRSILYSNKKKTLVIDLDETLIHSISRGTTHSNSSQAHIIEVRFAISGVSTLYYVHKRPYCDLFLSKVCKWYNLIIFTASMKEYADPVIDWLESSFTGRFSQRMYRNNCIMRDGVGYIKDLGNIKDSESKDGNIPLTDVIIIDNSPISYAMHVDNAIQVEGWISDPTDTELLNLLPFLEALRNTTDVRNVLSLKNAEKAFQLG